MLLSNSFLVPKPRLVLDTHEATFVTGLVPIGEPVIGADTDGPLAEGLALVVVAACLLQTKQPFVVPVPTVQGLVLGREALVAGCRTDIFHLVEQILLLLGQFRDFVAEDLCCKDEHFFVL